VLRPGVGGKEQANTGGRLRCCFAEWLALTPRTVSAQRRDGTPPGRVTEDMSGRVCSHRGHVRRLVRKPDGRFGGRAPLAQSAERLHGKEKVYGSIP
jgi:hypothetical protein